MITSLVCCYRVCHRRSQSQIAAPLPSVSSVMVLISDYLAQRDVSVHDSLVQEQ
jgi:hypothetical protein